MLSQELEYGGLILKYCKLIIERLGSRVRGAGRWVIEDHWSQTKTPLYVYTICIKGRPGDLNCSNSD